MQRCTYRVLEFAKSVLDPVGLEFAVLVRYEDLNDRFYKTFYLNRWQETVEAGQEEDISLAEDILYDFRQCARRSFAESDAIMKAAANLSNGPVRTRLAGISTLPQLSEISPELRNVLDIYNCSKTAFTTLVQTLVKNELDDSWLDLNT